MKTRSHNSKRLLVLYAIGFVFAGCGFAIAQDDSASPDGRRGSGLIVVAEANSSMGAVSTTRGRKLPQAGGAPVQTKNTAPAGSNLSDLDANANARAHPRSNAKGGVAPK